MRQRILPEDPMRITTLTLKNFRSHQETVLRLDRFNFIRGPNGCGKSSIQMALEYLFTGRCELTDGAGRGAEALIRAGEKELEVSATFENGDTICRRRTPRSHIVEINGKRVPVDTAEASLGTRFGSADVLSAVLNAGRFVEMPKAEQKKLFARVVEAGRVDIPEQICEALRALHKEPPKLVSIIDVESAYRQFYELRTDASRALTALGPMEKPDVPSDLPSGQEAKKKLEDLRQQKERLVARKAEADACWRIARGPQTQIEEVSSEILHPSQEQELLQLESKRSHADQLSRELTDLIAEHRAVEKTLATAQGLKDKCPTCQQPISEEAKAREVEASRKRLADLEGLIQGVREDLNESADLEKARSGIEAHRKTLDRHAILVEEQPKLKEAAKPDAGNVEGRMAILMEQINKGEQVLANVQQVQSAKERWEAYFRERSGLEARISLLDRLTEFFEPNGAIMAQASGGIASFTESLNQHLGAFGYTCNCALELFEIRVSSLNDNHFGLPLRHLSESEQFRFGVAFQIVLAMVTGVRFVVIDGADVLDKERRKMLTSLLLNSGIDQAIVLATSEEAPPSIVPEGVKFLSLPKGTKCDESLAKAGAP